MAEAGVQPVCLYRCHRGKPRSRRWQSCSKPGFSPGQLDETLLHRRPALNRATIGIGVAIASLVHRRSETKGELDCKKGPSQG
jgi:hypothetical protein